MKKIIFRIFRNIKAKKLLKNGDHVIIGLSGGPDSVFLLNGLNMMKDSLGISLSAIHVHHGIRGPEADRDVRFSKEMCEGLNIPIEICFCDAVLYSRSRGLSLEEGARILRYEAFSAETEKWKKKISGEVFLAVAHHMDDQAETVLHNMLRGSGLKGLSGMEIKREYIIRPLLDISRDEIISFLTEEGIPYVTDSTNMDTLYTRNRLRHIVMPELKKINPEYSSHIMKAAETIREADEYFREKARDFADKYSNLSEDGMVFDASEIKNHPGIIRRYVFMELVRRMGIPLKDWEDRHFRGMDSLIFGPGKGHMDLPSKLTADYINRKLLLRKRTKVLSMERKRKKTL